MTTINSDKEVAALKAFAEKRLTKTPTSYERVSVTVNLDAKVLEVYKKELYSEWNQAASIKGVAIPFTEEELSKYVDALICIRVKYVNGERVKVVPQDNIAVPSFLSLVLSNLGLARDTSLGLELYPALEGNVPEIDYDLVHRVSRAVRLLSNLGIEYAEGYTRSRDGSYEFMSMTLIGDYVLSWTNQSHPVYALLASSVGVSGIEAVLSPRINYGSVDHMQSLMRHLVAVKG